MFNDPVLLKLAVWALGFIAAVGAICSIMILFDGRKQRLCSKP